MPSLPTEGGRAANGAIGPRDALDALPGSVWRLVVESARTRACTAGDEPPAESRSVAAVHGNDCWRCAYNTLRDTGATRFGDDSTMLVRVTLTRCGAIVTPRVPRVRDTLDAASERVSANVHIRASGTASRRDGTAANVLTIPTTARIVGKWRRFPYQMRASGGSAIQLRHIERRRHECGVGLFRMVSVRQPGDWQSHASFP
jgi:hypothetical protein